MTFLNQLGWRYATKKFDETKPLTDETIQQIVDAAVMAPSSFGLQPFHITVVKNPEIKAKLRAAAWDQEQLTSAGAVIVFSAKDGALARIEQYLELASGGNPEIKTAMEGYAGMMRGALGSRTPDQIASWSGKQAYIALGFAMAAAAELQVDSCPMEGFDPAGFKDILGLSADLTPCVILPIGYRHADDAIRPKVRFPKSDMVSEI